VTTEAPALLDQQVGDTVLGGKADGSNALHTLIASIGAKAVVPHPPRRHALAARYVGAA
jgi:hypothetical protein